MDLQHLDFQLLPPERGQRNVFVLGHSVCGNLWQPWETYVDNTDGWFINTQTSHKKAHKRPVGGAIQ